MADGVILKDLPVSMKHTYRVLQIFHCLFSYKYFFYLFATKGVYFTYSKIIQCKT